MSEQDSSILQEDRREDPGDGSAGQVEGSHGSLRNNNINAALTARDFYLLFFGVLLLVIPLLFIVKYQQGYEDARVYLRIMSALGGAMIGAWLPGLLNLEGPGYKAGGALAILLLFFSTDPPYRTNAAVNSEYPDRHPIEIPVPESELTTPEPSLAEAAILPALAPELVCAFAPIKALGWSSGHKTNYCKFQGYEHGNFNQGAYSNGGICMTGALPEVCKSKVTNVLEAQYFCTTEGIKTKCFRRS